jgi:hypothetical protein
MTNPLVLMSTSAYAAACDEFARWATHGRRMDGAAWEAVVYPLVGIVARPGMDCSPLEAMPLAACAALVIPRVVLPPPALAHYGATWARPAAVRDPAAAALLQARLDAVRAQHPRLDCYGRMHSHPWPHRQPRPSGTDCAEHLTGALDANRAAGLPWALGLIAAAPDGRSAAWPIAAYALAAGGAVTDLGPVRVVRDADPRVRQVLARRSWTGPAGARRLERQVAAFRARGVAVTALPLHRGWYGLVLRSPGGPPRLLALPPGYPAAAPRLLLPAAGGWTGEAVRRAGRPHGKGYDLLDYNLAREVPA